MRNCFPGSIDHRAKKVSPIAQQKGEKDYEGNDNSKLRRKGNQHSSLSRVLVGFQTISECDLSSASSVGKTYLKNTGALSFRQETWTIDDYLMLYQF